MAEKDHFMRLVTFNVEVCPKPMQDLFIEKAKADTRPGLPFTTLDVFLSHHSATIKHMLNKNYIKVDPRSPTVDISQWDTTMVASMLHNIFKQSPLNHTFELTSVEKGHIETIRKIRNELQHSTTKAAIEQRDFNNIWIQLESAVYGIANAVGGSCLTEMTEHVNELKFRSIPGQAPVLSILTQWHNEFYDEAKATLQAILKISKGAKNISRSTIETLEKQTGKIIKKLKTSTIDHMKDQLNIRRSHIDLTDNIEHCPEVNELFSKLNTHHRVLMIDYSRGIDIRVAFAAMDKMGYDPERSVEVQNIEDWQHVFSDDVDVVLFIDPFGKREYNPSKGKAMAEKIDEILDVTKLGKNCGRKDILICSRNEPYLGWLEHNDDHELLDEVVKINKPTTKETPLTLTDSIKLLSQMDHESTAMNMLVQSRIYIENLQSNAYDTPSAEKAKRIFLNTNTLLIIGPNSYNMSILGAYLMKSYQPQECVVLTDPTEWKYIPLCHDMILKNRSHVISFVMVETFTGKFEYNRVKAYNWIDKFDQMYAAVQAGKLKVVLTCKSDHMKKIKAKLPTHGLFLSRISLSKKNNAGAKSVKLESRISLEACEEDFEESSDENHDSSNKSPEEDLEESSDENHDSSNKSPEKDFKESSDENGSNKTPEEDIEESSDEHDDRSNKTHELGFKECSDVNDYFCYTISEATFKKSSDETKDNSNNTLDRQERSQSLLNTKFMSTAGHHKMYSFKEEESHGSRQIVSCCEGPNYTFLFCDKRNDTMLRTDSINFCSFDKVKCYAVSAVVYPFMTSQRAATLTHRRDVRSLSLHDEMEESLLSAFRHVKDNCVTLSCSKNHSYMMTTTGDVYVYNTSFTHVLTIKTGITVTNEWPHQRMAVDENGTNIYVGGESCVKCFDQFGNQKWAKRDHLIDTTILLSIVDENVLVFNTITKRILEITPEGVMQHFLDISDIYGVPSAFCFTKGMTHLIMPELDTDNLHVLSNAETRSSIKLIKNTYGSITGSYTEYSMHRSRFF